MHGVEHRRKGLGISSQSGWGSALETMGTSLGQLYVEY